jgi:hypothetical protein
VDGKVGDTISVVVSLKDCNAAITMKKVEQLSSSSVEGEVAYESEVIMVARGANRIDAPETNLVDSWRNVGNTIMLTICGYRPSGIEVSVPPLPVSVSTPAPPESILAIAFPINVSLPEPPTALSIQDRTLLYK